MASRRDATLPRAIAATRSHRAGVVTGFFCVIKLLECCIDDVHHDVALQIERQEFIQCRVGVRPSRLT